MLKNAIRLYVLGSFVSQSLASANLPCPIRPDGRTDEPLAVGRLWSQFSQHEDMVENEGSRGAEGLTEAGVSLPLPFKVQAALSLCAFTPWGPSGLSLISLRVLHI